MGLETRTSILSGLPLRLVQIVCVLLILLKLAHLSFAGVFMDEAYYWMWGQHPALSYYDHPPLNAWLLSLSSAVFGWNVLALRFPVALTFIADIVALYLLARRIGGGDWTGHFWLTLLLFLVTPIFWIVSAYALPDHVLLTALLYATYFFLRFFADRYEGGAGATRDLVLGAMFLGLAGLAKYNAAFLGFGIVLFVLFYDRPLLRQPRLYLAALLALAHQAPVVIWNATENFASFGFILGGRHAGLATTLAGLPILLAGILILVGPFLLWPVARFAFARTPVVPGIGFARAAFGISTLAIFALASATLALFHWNLVAYVVMLPFLAHYMRPRWLIAAQSAWGIVFAVLAFVNYALFPVVDPGTFKDQSSAWSRDWSGIAQQIETARAEHGAGFVAATDYTTASLVAFATADRDVVSLAPERDQYDFWFDPAAHAGQSAILYVDRWKPLTGEIAQQFESLEEIGHTDVVANGAVLNRQTLYLAKGYKPQ